MNERKNKMFPDYSRILLQSLKTAWLSSAKTEAAMLRLDLLHPKISGNKWFKLKYNINAAIQQNKDTILTFGGARSNHIAATAAAVPVFGLKSIGLIRGGDPLVGNPTLLEAVKNGMSIHFVSRETYRHKTDEIFLQELQNKYPQAFIIPEGGNNLLGVKGAEEILTLCDSKRFTHICCPVGTGSTLAGIISKTNPEQQVIGFSALKKAGEQRLHVEDYLKSVPAHGLWQILTDYHFGGFARRTSELDNFMKTFEKEYYIPLDFVYTAKMIFGIKNLVEKGYFPPNSKLLIVHTGGLQGNIQ